MFRIWLWRILVSPLAAIYGMITGIRNMLYDKRILRSTAFSLPIIAIGNLNAGGAGKTPHTEYLIRLLRQYIHLGMCSRGYRRKSAGYLEVLPDTPESDCGDEALQYRRKFRDLMVVVSEQRTYGIMRMLMQRPELQCILLDDAFQHRAVKAGFNILCTPYDNLYVKDWLLPAGTLREWSTGARRAECIIVTKCPDDLTAQQRETIRQELQLLPQQHLFFSRYTYGEPYHWADGSRRPLHPDDKIVLLTGIASTTYLKEYLTPRTGQIIEFGFGDHHRFTPYDIGRATQLWKNTGGGSHAIILTTEKDAMRLEAHRAFLEEHQVPVYLLPVEVDFFNEQAIFDALIRQVLLGFTA